MSASVSMTRIGAAFALAAMTVPTAAIALDSKTPVAPATKEDAAAARRLAAAIRAEIGDQKAAPASAEDLEGMIVFVVSQGVYSDTVVADALDRIGGNATPALAAAIANVRLALLDKLKRGTAGVHASHGVIGGVSAGPGGNSFSTPGVSSGGGSVNYSS